MPFAYTIDGDSNLINLQITGSFSEGQIRENIARVNADPKFRKGLNTLADITDARADIGYQQMRQFARYVETLHDVRGECKWAILAPTDVSYGMSRMLEALTDSPSIHIQAFRSRKQALRWLGLPENYEPDVPPPT